MIVMDDDYCCHTSPTIKNFVNSKAAGFKRKSHKNAYDTASARARQGT